MTRMEEAVGRDDGALQQPAERTVRQSLTELLTRRSVRLIGGAIVVLVAAGVPFFLTGYWVRLITSMFMYAALASSLNIIMGYAGYADFGNVVFFGIGAYTTAILMKEAGVPFLLAMPLGGLLCSAFAAVLGLPILRLRGSYFAIASMGLSQAMRELARNLEITGGGVGYSVPMLGVDPRVFNTAVYFLMFGLMALSVLVSYIVLRRRFGYGLRAIKADEEGASVMGIDTTRHKVVAWALSAFLTGMVGGAFGLWFAYFTPDSVFNISVSVKALVMVYLGGVGTVAGPVIGAFLLQYVSDTIWSRFLEIHLGVLGLAIILIVLFIPKGFLHMVRTQLRPLLSRMIARTERS